MNDKIIETMNLVIKLIKLYTPEAPIYEGDGYYNGELVYDTWICPNCEERYEVGYDTHKHCEECGQRIDWSSLHDKTT